MYANGEGCPQGRGRSGALVPAGRRPGSRRCAVQSRRTCTTTGEGVLKDEAEAVRWYRLAADQGHAAAQFNLGEQVLQRARASSRTRPKRCALVPAGRRAGSRRCAVQSREHVLQRAGRPARTRLEAVTLVPAGRRPGRRRAPSSTSVSFTTDGSGRTGGLRAVSGALASALAAEQGVARAQFNLGVMYANRRGCPQGLRPKLVRWFPASACSSRVTPAASSDLGGMVQQRERGVLKDDAEAVRLVAASGRRAGSPHRPVRPRFHVRQRRGCPQGRGRSGALVPAGCRAVGVA